MYLDGAGHQRVKHFLRDTPAPRARSFKRGVPTFDIQMLPCGAFAATLQVGRPRKRETRYQETKLERIVDPKLCENHGL